MEIKSPQVKEKLNPWMEAIEQSIQKMEGSFNSTWDDDVHDSFYQYVFLFVTNTKNINQSMDDVYETFKGLDMIDSKEIQREFDDLVKWTYQYSEHGKSAS